MNASPFTLELLLHPAQGKTGTNQLADETGPNTAADGPGSCHPSGMHSEVLLAPLKGSCHANEVLWYLLLLPGGHCAQSPPPGASQPWAQPFQFLNWVWAHSTCCLGPSTLPPRNDDMAREAVSLAVIGRKQLQLLWQTESPAAKVGVVRAAEVLRAPASHSEERKKEVKFEPRWESWSRGQFRFLSSLSGCEEGHHLALLPKFPLGEAGEGL